MIEEVKKMLLLAQKLVNEGYVATAKGKYEGIIEYLNMYETKSHEVDNLIKIAKYSLLFIEKSQKLFEKVETTFNLAYLSLCVAKKLIYKEYSLENQNKFQERLEFAKLKYYQVNSYLDQIKIIDKSKSEEVNLFRALTDKGLKSIEEEKNSYADKIFFYKNQQKIKYIELPKKNNPYYQVMSYNTLHNTLKDTKISEPQNLVFRNLLCSKSVENVGFGEVIK